MAWQDSDPVLEFTITTENNQPIAAIEQDPENPVSIGNSVQLDGSTSSDADNDPLSYRLGHNQFTTGKLGRIWPSWMITG